MKVVLIPCGPTEWHDEGRLLGRVEDVDRDTLDDGYTVGTWMLA